MAEKIEGIVLRSQEYKENQRIITLFTPQGVLGVIVKGLASKMSSFLTLTTPLCHGEYHIVRGNSELCQLRDGTVLNAQFILRDKLEWLRTAGCLTQLIVRSQMPHKPTPELFFLYRAYLAQIPKVQNLSALSCSFILKAWRLEGEWDESQFAVASAEERSQIEILLRAKKFSELEPVHLAAEILRKLGGRLRERGLEPLRETPLPPQSSASTNSATLA